MKMVNIKARWQNGSKVSEPMSTNEAVKRILESIEIQLKAVIEDGTETSITYELGERVATFNTKKHTSRLI